ncbi:MAG: 50S ribosomal protein L11 methyltransferase [Chloroflexota bacterium]|nr:50S ribosomal protein L11 methyltransferase [Chloroflexota bacterium]
MRWLALTVEADVEAIEAVSEVFGRLGRGAAVRPTRLIRDPHDELSAREDTSAPYELTVHIPDDAAAADALDATQRALWHLQAFGLRPLGGLQVTAVEESDWMEAWKVGYTPQRIGRIVVLPSWLDEPVSPAEVSLRLDPGMAFGTGLHPTTRGCLRLIQELRPTPRAILDVGSGSGILALAALKLGAERAVCFDTDAAAVDATRANAASNGLGDRIDARRGSLPEEPDERFPLVVANLVASLLVELALRLAAHAMPGATLVVSGIINHRAGEVIEALAAAGLSLLARIDEDEWVSLHLERA